jgi:hypothetical protein
MAEYEKKVRKKLLEYGCSFLRHGKGDHDMWPQPDYQTKFSGGRRNKVPASGERDHEAGGD